MRKSFLLLLNMIICMAMFAGEVTEQEAMQKALQFMGGKPLKAYRTSKSLARGSSSSEKQFLYIFNVDGDDGFVVVSGDDRVVPVLGYSSTGTVDENMPDNLKYWLDCYARQIELLPDDYQSGASAARTRSAKAEILPLIKTTWDQGAPYNLQCPIYDGSQSVTGCVATALAQVLFYHKWPESCPALPSYTNNYWNNVTVPELTATTFKWDKMKESYESDETGDAADAVAELMRYCGQAMEMWYSPTASGANLKEKNIVNYLGYSGNLHIEVRRNYSVKEWEQLIYDELADGRPVLYGGSSSSGGHQFVCDGYDGEGYFHLNWGWGGYCDSYFVLSIADPQALGIGGGTSTDGYSMYQDAVIGMKPAVAGEVVLPQMNANSVSDFTSTVYNRESATDDFTNVSISNWVFPVLLVDQGESVNLELGWGLFYDDELLACLGYQEVSTDYSKNNSGIMNSVTASFGASLPDGDYKIYQIYRAVGAEKWVKCSSSWYSNSYLVAEVSAKSMTLRGSTANEPSFVVNSIAFSDDPEENYPIQVTINLTNDGDSYQETVYLWIGQNSSWEKVAATEASIEPGQTGEVCLSFSVKQGGDYDVKVTSDYAGKQIRGTDVISIATLQTVTIDGLTYVYNSLSKKAKVTSGDYAELESVTVPATIHVGEESYTVKAIDDSAFKSCMSLSSVTLPSTIESIGVQAFWNDNSIKQISLPEGIKSIGKYAFAYCFGLKSVRLPSTVNFIADKAFYNCNALSSVTALMPEPVAITSDAFTNRSNATLHVFTESKAVYETAEYWEEFGSIEAKSLKDEMTETPLTLAAIHDGTITVNNPLGLTIRYSIDGRASTESAVNEISIPVIAGQRVLFYGNNASYATEDIHTRISCSDDFCAYGNIMSLIDADNYATDKELVGSHAFRNLFRDNPHLNNHSIYKLLLPATLLSAGCYLRMFQGCSSLTSAPELPATELADSCYQRMFQDCSSLESFPELPATTLSLNCYSWMFLNCEALKTAPDLPVEVLTDACYKGMFEGCAGLTASPRLPALALAKESYRRMFRGCTNLSSITMLATDVSAKDCLTDWVEDVAVSGKFIKNLSAMWNMTGISGVPANWIKTYKVKTGTVYPSGQQLDFDNISLTIGETGGSDFDQYILDGYVHNGVNGHETGGSCYFFEPKEDGILSVDVNLNDWKVLYVLEDGVSMEGLSGYMVNEPYAGNIGFSVKAGKTYKVYADGSRLGLGGFTFPGEIAEIPSNVNTEGETFTDAGLNYRVTSLAQNTVDLIGSVYAGEIIIPHDANYYQSDGSEYRSFTVAGISNDAFKDCTNLTGVDISENVSTIGSNAFAGCQNLGLVTVNNPSVVNITETTFTNRSKAILYVPEGCIDAYKAASYWNEFSQILPIGCASDVDALTDAIYADAAVSLNGEKCMLTINLKNTQSISAYSFDLILPEGVMLAKENDEYVYELSSRHKDHLLTINYNESTGSYSLSVQSLSGEEVSGNDGAVITCKLDISADMALGDYNVRIQNAIYSLLSDNSEVSMGAVISKLTICDCKKGDPNGDGDIDIADAVFIVNYVVGKPTTSFLDVVADVNGDGDVDIADAVYIVNIVVGKIEAFARGKKQGSELEPE